MNKKDILAVFLVSMIVLCIMSAVGFIPPITVAVVMGLEHGAFLFGSWYYEYDGPGEGRKLRIKNIALERDLFQAQRDIVALNITLDNTAKEIATPTEKRFRPTEKARVKENR